MNRGAGDAIDRFLTSRCRLDAEACTSARDLCAAYASWAAAVGAAPLSAHMLGRELGKSGLRPRRSKAARFWCGVAVLDVDGHVESVTATAPEASPDSDATPPELPAVLPLPSSATWRPAIGEVVSVPLEMDHGERRGFIRAKVESFTMTPKNEHAVKLRIAEERSGFTTDHKFVRPLIGPGAPQPVTR